MKYFKPTELVSILKFNELLNYLEENSQTIPNSIFDVIREDDNLHEPLPLTNRKIFCISQNLKQYPVSKSYWFDGNDFKFTTPEWEMDLLLISQICPSIRFNSNASTIEFNLNKSQIELEEFMIENDVNEQALGKVEKDILHFRSTTLPTVIFADSGIYLKALTNSEALEIVKLLYLFNTELKKDYPQKLRFLKQQDPDERSYNFFEASDESVTKPYLVVKIKYSSTIEYLARMEVITVHELKIAVGFTKKFVSDFYKKFEEGAKFKFGVQLNKATELYEVLKEEVEFDNRTFIAELLHMMRGVIEFEGLKYDLNRGVLYYNGEELEVSINTMQGKFIKALILAQGGFVYYESIAQLLGIYVETRYADPAHKVYGEQIKFARQKLINRFKKDNTRAKLTKLIYSKAKIGYKLLPATKN